MRFRAGKSDITSDAHYYRRSADLDSKTTTPLNKRILQTSNSKSAPAKTTTITKTTTAETDTAARIQSNNHPIMIDLNGLNELNEQQALDLINSTIQFENVENNAIRREERKKKKKMVKYFLKSKLNNYENNNDYTRTKSESVDNKTLKDASTLTTLHSGLIGVGNDESIAKIDKRMMDACVQTISLDQQIDAFFESINFDKLVSVLAEQLYADCEHESLNAFLIETTVLPAAVRDRGKVVPESPPHSSLPASNIVDQATFQKITVIEDTPDRMRNKSLARLRKDNDSSAAYKTPTSNRIAAARNMSHDYYDIILDTPTKNQDKSGDSTSMSSDLNATLCRTAARAECVNASKIIRDVALNRSTSKSKFLFNMNVDLHYIK